MKTCEECGKRYQEKAFTQKYCSDTCASKHYSTRGKVVGHIYPARSCDYCGMFFNPRRINQRFHSQECAKKYRKSPRAKKEREP